MLFGPANDNAVSFLLSSEIAVNQVGDKVLVKSELYTTELFDLADVTGDLTAPTIGDFLTYLSTNFTTSVVIAPPAGGFATETTLDLANQNLDNISASTGLKADATANIETLTGTPTQENNQIQLLKAQNVNFGFRTQAAAGTDIADVGFIGLFKRLLQSVTTLITNLGSPFQAGGALGAGTATIGNIKQAGSVATTLTSTNINMVGTLASTEIAAITADLPANSNRVFVTITNNSNKTLFFAVGNTITATNFVYPLTAGSVLIFREFEVQKLITAFWITGGAASGNLTIKSYTI
jgi:hypothetical protein